MEMYFRSVKNIRDLGGIMTKDGHRIKEKMLIRSSTLDALSPYEFDILKNEYNLNLVIDFRTTKSFVNKPDLVGNIRREHLITYKFLETQQFTHDIGCECDDFFLKVYRGITLSEESKEAYAKFLRLVLENEKGSVLFHCTSGKDRTGIASLLLLHILGVDKETIIKEHMKTFNSMYPYFKKDLDELKEVTPFNVDFLYCLYLPKVIYINYWYQLVEENYGGVDNYIKNVLKFSENDIMTLRKRYLE